MENALLLRIARDPRPQTFVRFGRFLGAAARRQAANLHDGAGETLLH